jgi:hypothetical protein
MKKYFRTIACSIVFVSTSTLLFANNSLAKTDAQPTKLASSIDRISAVTRHKILQEKSQPIISEAAEVASETQKAVVALENNDSKKANSILQGVSSKLDGILAKNPGMALIPIDVEADVFDFDGDNKSISKAIDNARDLLKSGKLQNARQLLEPMASEIRVTTTNIPLGTFPTAIKQAISNIDAGKTDQAAVDLSDELNTLEETTEIMPLPVLRAEALLTEAARLEHTDDLSKDKNRVEIQKFTDAAKDKLELAKLLGYGDKDDYKLLYKEIDAINKALFTEKSEAIWQNIKDRFNDLKDTVNRIGHPANLK